MKNTREINLDHIFYIPKYRDILPLVIDYEETVQLGEYDKSEKIAGSIIKDFYQGYVEASDIGGGNISLGNLIKCAKEAKQEKSDKAKITTIIDDLKKEEAEKNKENEEDSDNEDNK